jgi:hypothetical protein
LALYKFIDLDDLFWVNHNYIKNLVEQCSKKHAVTKGNWNHLTLVSVGWNCVLVIKFTPFCVSSSQ